MTLRVFNTLSRRKEDLVPGHGGEVGIYVCGVTVYDVSHIGHGRSAIVFDVIRRYLRHRGYAVKFVKNFTDIDDKIIRRANQEGVTAHEISERYIAEYRADMASLGVLAADVEPKATEHIPQMIALIERLIQRGVAYPVEGDVYFEVRRFPGYGKLSGKNLEELQAGARVEVDERKRDPLDFALWKATKPGEPSWKSPWGDGRPGWHIECSAMAMQYLGETLDLHGGGEDLVFPHHENEIAQSEAATGRPFVRQWTHNGFVNLAAEKMSKSLGNTLTIKDLVRRHDPEALRLYLLGTHYREMLACIRCGACLNVCPVFRTVGGHTYGTTYPGPIGSVLTPHLRGIDEFHHLSYASSLCGACTDACPVKIDLHHHLLENRRNAVNHSARPWAERMGFKIWQWTMQSAWRFRLVGGLARMALRVTHGLGLGGTALDPMGPWSKNHAAPRVPEKSFRALWGKNAGN